MPFIGNIIFNFIGGSVRYIYGTIWRTLLKRERFTFFEYINGPKNKKNLIDNAEQNLANVMVGMLTMLIVLGLLTYYRI